MAITSYSQVRHSNATTVTVVSGLSGTIYYHWYVHGDYAGMTLNPSKTFYASTGEQLRVTCQDTNNAAYDPIANAPGGYHSRRTLYWVRSLDADTAKYRIEQQKDGGSWVEIGTVRHEASKWNYYHVTPPLTDLSAYQWRVIPEDIRQVDGTAITFDETTVVRTPDAPQFSATAEEFTA